MARDRSGAQGADTSSSETQQHRDQGVRKIGQSLQVDCALTTLDLDSSNALAGEIQRLRALDANLLVVMMSMHTRLGAESGLKVLDDHLVTLIWDLFKRRRLATSSSKASSLLGKAGVVACPGKHHLKTCAVADETPSAQASCVVCLKTLPVVKQVFSCRACDSDGCPDCRARAHS